ncbi:MAG: hypothetical protein EP329_28045 [Deltaproteobacteria bacterium]|nr:MAG: hypothetical protein EP329_28045 [Deltaproteobacteria bacterium]
MSARPRSKQDSAHPRSAAGEARVRDTLVNLWRDCREDWSFVTSRLAQAFREARQLHSRERREVAETLYGMVRRARALDFALAGAGVETPPEGTRRSASRAYVDLLAYRVLYEGMAARAAASERPDVPWDRVEAALASVSEEPDALTRFGLEHSFPDWIATRLLAERPDDAGALAASLNERAPLTVRANRLKNTREQLATRLRLEGVETEPTRFSSDGLHLLTRVNVFGLGAFRDGLFEVQDEASQLAAELVAPAKRGLVVDACAGAGGKTLALGALMASKGRLLAMDVSPKKLDELGRRARRAGLSNHRWEVVDAEGPLPPSVARLRGKADRVLVDAPCSGVGSMRRNPEARWRMAPEFIDALPATQLAIALRAAPLVAPGGRLIYATCTVFEAENEAVVRRILEAEPDFERVPVKEILGKARAEELATRDGFALAPLPHLHGMDGFYATVLRRRKPA